MKRIPAMILALLTAAALLVGCGTSERKIQAEPNTSYNADRYPYVLRTESATWYLAKDDIEMMGEDAFFENLYALIDDAEADFKDAREALKGYIPDEIPPVDILTDFCNRTPISAIAAAYYNENVNFIKLFYGWDAARATLTHEYVHYLTVHCAENPYPICVLGGRRCRLRCDFRMRKPFRAVRKHDADAGGRRTGEGKGRMGCGKGLCRSGTALPRMRGGLRKR